MSTFDEAYSAFRSEVEGRESTLTDWSDGAANDGLAGGVGRVVELLSAEIAKRFLAKYFKTAEGTDLDELAADLLDVTRQAAAYATVTIRLTRPTAAAGDIAIGTSQVLRTDPDAADDQVRFKPTIPYVLSGIGPLDMQCRAVVAGRAGNVAVDSVKVAEPPLADATVVITNPAVGSGGDDAWSDDRFRTWLYDYVKTLARGTVLALITGAKSVPGVAAASVDESQAGPDSTGIVKVYIGDVNGEASALLVAAVVTELENWRGAGIRTGVEAGTRTNLAAVTLTVRMRGDDYDAGYIGSTAKTAASQSVDDLAPDERLFQERIDAAAYAALGGAEEVADVTASHVGGWPVAPDPGRSLRLLEANITVVVLGPSAP
jgi:hypothetical protein